MTDRPEELYPEHLRQTSDTGPELALLRKSLIVKRATLFLVGLLVVMFAAGGALFSFQIRQAQKSNTPIARDTHSLVEYVKDCTDPNGSCSRENRARLAEALSDLDAQNRRVSSAAAACSLGVPTTWSQHRRYKAIKKCVDRTLAMTNLSQ